MLSIQIKPYRALTICIQIVSHYYDVVPSFLLLSQINLCGNNLACVLANALDILSCFVYLNICTHSMNALYENMSSLGVIQSDGKDYPKADGPSLHDAVSLL